MIPALGVGALSMFSLALLVAAISASSLRWLAIAPAIAGLAMAAAPGRPDIYVDRDGQGAAIRNASGRLVFVGKTSAFVAEQWLRADGDSRDAAEARSLIGGRQDGSRCDPEGCVVETVDRRTIAFVRKPSAFEEDCGRAEIVITRLKAPPHCTALLVLDRQALAARGATTIRVAQDRIEIRSVRKGHESIARAPAATPPPVPAARPTGRPAGAVPEQDIPEDDAADMPGDDLSIGAPD